MALALRQLNPIHKKGSYFVFLKFIRQDGNKDGSRILLCIQEDIPTNVLSIGTLPIEGDTNLHNKTWLLSCSYNPEKGNIKNNLQALSTNLDMHSSQFDHFIILGDFHVEIENIEMKEFCLNYNLKNLIRATTSFKNPETSSYIDLILTNFARSSKVVVL